MLISNVSSLECSSSKDFRMNRSAIKAKLRSVVSTPSRLLVDAILEQEQMKESNESCAERHPNKVHNVEENLPFTSGVRRPVSRDSYYFGKSGRSEDIYVREDENGIRSHYCPLRPERDGEKEEKKKVVPDRPMQVNLSLEELLSNCNLPSEEIYTYLKAEKPPQCKSEDSDSSSNDSYIPPEYSPLDSQSNGSDISPLKFLQQFSKRVPDRMLDENTMKAWTEDSSDELDSWDVYSKDFEVIQNRTIGNESDMEEFEQDSGEDNEKNDVNASQKKDKDSKDLSADSKSDSKARTESNSESFNNMSRTKNLENDASKDENMKKSNSDSDYSARDEHCANDDSRNETEANHNSEAESKNKKEDSANHSVKNSIVKSVHWADIRAKNTYFPETANKTDESHQDYFNDSCSEIRAMETAKDTSEGNEAKLTMEPVGMNISRFSKKDGTQPDLIKELPIMSEVYHTIEDELFSETFLTIDEIDKISVKEKSEVPDKLEGSERQDLIDLPVFKSVRKSSTLEIKDDQKVAPKSQNKLLKFFQSFKRKFDRTKKAA